MIVFDKLWIKMKERGVSQYKLIREYGISTGQLDRLRKNSNINSYTLDQLCKILQCDLSDIAEYKDDAQVIAAEQTDKCEQKSTARFAQSFFSFFFSCASARR